MRIFGKIVQIVFLFLIILQPFATSGKEFYFTHYDITNGLSQNTVHKILQDRQGFMWFATKDGLNRFDGVNFQRIDVDDKEMSISFISTIFEDSKGNIWVGSHKGLGLYNPKKEKLEWVNSVTTTGESIHATINDFEETADGSILISVENDGVFSYQNETQTLKRILTNSDYGINSIMQICRSNDGSYYLGTFGKGVFHCDENFQALKKVESETGDPNFNESTINSLLKYKGRIYIGTSNIGVHYIDEDKRVRPLFIKDEIGEIPFVRDLSFNKESELFIATEKGLYIYNLPENKLASHLRHDYMNRYSLSDDAIYSILFDRENGLWIGSYFGGIDYEGVRFPSFRKYIITGEKGSLKAKRIRELCEGKDGLIYVGSEDGGLSVFNPYAGSFSKIPGIEESNIHGISVEGDRLWIGTFSQGMILVDLKNGKQKRYRAGDKSNLANDFVFNVCRTHTGEIYAGTFTGLQKFDPVTETFQDIPQFKDIFVYNIFEDHNGNLWVSTYSNGLFLKKMSHDEWVNFTEIPGEKTCIPSNKVYSVEEDSHGNIWVMTQNGASVFKEEEKIFDDTFCGINFLEGVVYRMEEDNIGRYWLTSNHGIYCIDPQKKKIWNFTTKEGLPTNQFNYNSSLRLKDGTLLFGSIGGLVSFDPLNFIPEHALDRQPVVTELYIHSRLTKPGEENSPLSESITMTDKIVLEPWQNSVSFRLSPLIYNNPSGQKIKYRLQGYDKEWHYVEIDNAFASYPNLPAGKYELQAVLSSNDEESEGPLYKLAVVVNLPIYARWWAILGYVMVGLAILYFLYYYYRRYNNLSNERYIENYKHNKEKELYDSKINFFTNVAHEIRTPLTLIKAPLDTVSRNRNITSDPEIKEHLKVVNLNVDRLLQLTNQLLDFRKIESGKYILERKECDVKELLEKLLVRFKPTIESKNKNVELSISEGKIIAAIDAEAVTKIFSNLITNAIKYSDKNIKISLSQTEKGILFKISNDGKIISREEREKIFSLFTRLDNNAPGTGIGLTFSKSLAEMHGGKLELEDNEDENVFILSLPFGEEDSQIEKTETESDLDRIARRSGDNENVLIVEDNPELLSFLQKTLISQNYKVFAVTSGEDALLILEEQHIDIVISDIMMPGMDGNELLRRIKDNIHYSHIPVILLTAKTNIEDKLESLEAGADYYIEKPFSTEYLLVSMASLLRNRDRVRHKIETKPLEKIHEKELKKTDEEFLRKINEIIVKNFNRPDFSVDEIVEQIGMGSTTFYRKIKGLLNQNPNQYIRYQRLKRAAELFREGHTSVSEVCYLVGFSSPGYFAKCFQQQFGISPTDYIKGKI